MINRMTVRIIMFRSLIRIILIRVISVRIATFALWEALLLA